MHQHQHTFERRTGIVVLITAITMVVEIIFGLSSHSMALLADGIHMGSHVLAIGLSWLAYIIVRKATHNKNYQGDPNKILSLSGYTSGLLLLVFAFFILAESVERFFNMQQINYNEAITVAAIGLVVNIASAFLLHHDHEKSDHNIKSAYLHVLADALTSVSAIIGLFVAKKWGINWVDPAVATLSSFIIIRWSVKLLKASGKTLLGI